MKKAILLFFVGVALLLPGCSNKAQDIKDVADITAAISAESTDVQSDEDIAKNYTAYISDLDNGFRYLDVTSANTIDYPNSTVTQAQQGGIDFYCCSGNDAEAKKMWDTMQKECEENASTDSYSLTTSEDNNYSRVTAIIKSEYIRCDYANGVCLLLSAKGLDLVGDLASAADTINLTTSIFHSIEFGTEGSQQ